MAKWFEKSEQDRKVALLLLEKGFYSEACLHAHMAVELKFKGFILQHTGTLLYTHSLRRPIAEIEKIKGLKVSEEILDCANRLSMLYTASRYPEESLVDLDRLGGEKCVECMEKLLDLV